MLISNTPDNDSSLECHSLAYSFFFPLLLAYMYKYIFELNIHVYKRGMEQQIVKSFVFPINFIHIFSWDLNRRNASQSFRRFRNVSCGSKHTTQICIVDVFVYVRRAILECCQKKNNIKIRNKKKKKGFFLVLFIKTLFVRIWTCPVKTHIFTTTKVNEASNMKRIRVRRTDHTHTIYTACFSMTNINWEWISIHSHTPHTTNSV